MTNGRVNIECRFIMKEIRMYVKIKTGQHNAVKVHYWRTDMKYDFFKKWEWYFEWRSAKLKFENPKMKVEIHKGSFDFIPPFDILEKRIKDDLKGRKSALTKFDNKISAAKFKLSKKNEGKLFKTTIEQEKGWEDVQKKRMHLMQRVQEAEKQLQQLISGELEIPESSHACEFFNRECKTKKPYLDNRKKTKNVIHNNRKS